MLLTLALLAGVLRLSYKEDISDFLPLDSRNQEAMQTYQDISGADRLFAIFQYKDSTKADAEKMVAAMDAFAEEVQQHKEGVTDLIALVDMEQATELLDFVYQNIPYFLTPTDYARMESIVSNADSIQQQLRADKELLQFPGSNLLTDNLARDPLNLFTPIVQELQKHNTALNFELYDGHIFSPDMQRGIVMMRSAYGSSETEHNAELLARLDSCWQQTTDSHPNITMHIMGGPAIAVGNASQIKTDTTLSVGIAVALILALLFYSLRNVRHLLLIAMSIGWGWLFAMGCLATVHCDVSIIVIGISSVILGIAVNYPLHLIAHLSHTPDIRTTLHELAAPLVVGNVTTVGAFLALVPLHSVALRDLGLFAAFLLIGTILFVLFYLPHIVKTGGKSQRTLINKMGEWSIDNKPWMIAVVVGLTVVFGWFGLRTTFDPDLSHINYMTDEQRADMDYLAHLTANTTGMEKVYSLSTATTLNAALDSNSHSQAVIKLLKERKLVTDCQTIAPFLCTEQMQHERLQAWNAFVTRHRDALIASLNHIAAEEGFAQDAFSEFFNMLNQEYKPQPLSYFDRLTVGVFSGNICHDSKNSQYNIVDVLSVHSENVAKVERLMQEQGCYTFDIQGMNSAIANHLSDDFNYIGWACGSIVFLFLWLSFGSIELAILSFIPMAVSWVWILGIMSLLDMQFNIVNVILATFIFGQGDDYTIFMTEGACYEYAYRRKMLASYKHSIILSALIMFIGIGTLILAKHPALRSLAELTIAGMFSVVLMAYVFPPLIFRWLVQKNGQYRMRPLSIALLYEKTWKRKETAAAQQALECGKQTAQTERYLRRVVYDRYRYKGTDVCRAVSRGLKTPLPHPKIIDGKAHFTCSGYGEQALLYALTHPDVVVVAIESDTEKATVARWAADGITHNIIFTENAELAKNTELSDNQELSQQ